MRLIALALALGLCTMGAFAEEGDDGNAPATPDFS